MRVFTGPLWVHYGQAYVISAGGDAPDLEDAFRGQANGLCGTAVPGTMFLITGLHTGQVDFNIDIVDSPAVLDHSWEEIVETPFVATDSQVALFEWGETNGHPLPLKEGEYRARYSARHMQAGHDQDTSGDDAAIIDSYLLQLWPAPVAPDRVVRQTSEIAAYWHAFARRTPRYRT